MENVVVYIGASLVLLAVGFAVGRVSAGLDRQDRLSDEQRTARRDAMIRYIHDTRDQLLGLLELVEVIAAGDYRRGAEAAKAYSSRAHPASYNELTADEELVRELTATLPEVMERGWGKAKDREASERLRRVGLVIRRAMRDQELRVINGEEPLLATPEQRRSWRHTAPSPRDPARDRRSPPRDRESLS